MRTAPETLPHHMCVTRIQLARNKLLRALRMAAFAILLAAGLASVQAAAAESKPAVAAIDAGIEAPLTIFNRDVMVFRAPFLGIPPEKRASRARVTITEILRGGEDLPVTIRKNPEGRLLMIGDTLAFVVIEADTDPLRNENLDQVAERAATNLRQVIAETLEARSLESLLRSSGYAGVATLVFLALLWGLSKLRHWLAGLLLQAATRRAEALKLGETKVLEDSHVTGLLGRLMKVARWLIVALLSYEWLSFVLSSFPYTRPWGESLNGYLVSIARDIGLAVLGALPGLGIAVVIFLLARFASGFVGGALERLSRGNTTLSWLGSDTMPTTRRLFSFAIWVFAIAMAYPYLPGAQTEAFKGMSVLLGLMVSLGASSMVGQGAAGLILTYTRTLRAGEYVRVGDHEGTVVRTGLFTTTIHTGLGEELTLPNSMITGTVTKNYSRTVHRRGYIIDTTVTIGYDTPWRQVEAMLIEAAKRTAGILDTPPPRVFQTGLMDFYTEYRLVAQAVPSQPRPRAEVLTQLHANIQDVFSEHGVQIMSPHYMEDPASEKVPKPEDWYRAPAKKP